MSALLGLVLTVFLGACASTVGNELTVFHQWPSDGGERSFRFVRTAKQQDSLAHANFEATIGRELARAGFKPGVPYRFEIGFDYESRELTRYRPDYGPFFSPYLVLGTGGPHSYFRFGLPLTWWSGDHQERYYQRRLNLTIADRTASPTQRVYEATAVNTGLQPGLTTALPYLVRALLKDFPGPSGQVRWVDVPADPSKSAN